MITKTRQDTTLLLTYFSGVCQTKKVAWLGGYFMCPTTFHVTEVFTEPDWRNQGIATALFKRLFYELKKNKIQQITLDDCSDIDNYYLKLGFHYLEEGYPEMVMRL